MTKFAMPARIAATLIALCISICAQDPKTAIQQKLQTEYAVTQPTAAEDDIVTAGAILVLKKGNLVMSPSSSTNFFQNTYKDGKISQNAIGKGHSLLDRMNHLPGMSTPTGSSRTYVPGEKMWLTKIDVKDEGLVLYFLNGCN